MAESIEQLSFELSHDALAEQERSVSALRGRAGTLLAAASVAGSFFGARADHSALGAWGVSAMISFALCATSAVWILLPHTFVFAFDGDALLAEGERHGTDDLADAYRAAGRWVRSEVQANRDKIARLSRFLALGCAALAVEIVLWTVALII